MRADYHCPCCGAALGTDEHERSECPRCQSAEAATVKSEAGWYEKTWPHRAWKPSGGGAS